MPQDKNRQRQRRIHRPIDIRINHQARLTKMPAITRRRLRPAGERTITKDHGPIAVVHIPPRALPIPAAAWERRQRILRRDRPVFRRAIRWTPPAARDVKRQRHIERRPIRAGLPAGDDCNPVVPPRGVTRRIAAALAMLTPFPHDHIQLSKPAAAPPALKITR